MKTFHKFGYPPVSIRDSDIIIKGGYPTHTHGLWNVGLPELFINATAFGPRDNAAVLNVVFEYLATHEDDFYRVRRGEYVEFSPWEGTVLCIRSVQAMFAGVQKAYNLEIEADRVLALSIELIRMFAQVYVKGDYHVLEDSYYADSDKGSP